MDSENKKTKFKFDDFMPSNPIVRPWMKPYLPKNPRARDLTMAVVGCGLTYLVILGALLVTSNEWIIVGILLVGGTYFIAPVSWGLFEASNNYQIAIKMEKLKSKNPNTKSDAS